MPFESPTVKYWIGLHPEIEPTRIISLGLEDHIFSLWLHMLILPGPLIRIQRKKMQAAPQ